MKHVERILAAAPGIADENYTPRDAGMMILLNVKYGTECLAQSARFRGRRRKCCEEIARGKHLS